MKNIKNILFLYFFIFVMCMGASFAWYAWQGNNVNVTVDFAGIEPYIDYRESSGDCGTDSLASNAIVFQKKDIGTNLDIYGRLYLHIDSATSNDLFKSSSYKWRLCKIDSSNETTLVSSGNFVGEAVGNNIPLSIDFELDNYSTVDDTRYVIETYIDEESNNNLDISDSVMVSTWDPNAYPSEQDDVLDDVLYIRNIEYGAGKITNLGFYSSKYEITEYMIINSTIQPNANDERWIPVTSSEATTEPGYIANVTNVNHTMTNINNICIKNSNPVNDNEDASDDAIYCKSIEKQNDVISNLPSEALCSNPTYNGEPQQLVSETSGIGYTLSGDTGTNAGDYTIIATLKSGYEWNSSDKTGNITFICSIGQYDLSNAKIAEVPNQTYTGSKIKPIPAVTVPLPEGSTTTLSENTDFTYGYSNNTNVGTATITINGIDTGNYKGTNSATFKIVYEYYTITLDPNDGSGGTSTLYERYADGIYLNNGYTNKMTESDNPITKPTRVGYTFDGYYDGDTQMINADGYITSEFTNMKYRTNEMLIAKWIVNTYTVDYQFVGGSVQGSSNLIAKYDGYLNNHNTHSSSTTTWYDFNSKQNGTISNGTWGDNYLSFNGTSTWVNLGQMNSNYQTIEVTFSTNDPSSAQFIVGNWNTGGGGIDIAGSKLTGEFYINSSYQILNSGITLEANKIYHAALTYDGTTERLYLDGEQVASKEIIGTIGTPSSSTVMALGVNPSGNTSVDGDFFNGKIYNVSVYNVALTSTQIAEDFGKNVTYGSTYGILPTPIRTGYIFDGWYTSQTGGTKVTSSSTVSIASDHTLYARWNVYQIYDSGGNSVGYATSLSDAISAVESGGTITALADNTETWNNYTENVTTNKSYTLNTNGKTINVCSWWIHGGTDYTVTLTGSGTLTCSESDRGVISQGVNLTIDGPTIKATGTTPIWSYGKLQFTSGTIKAPNHYALAMGEGSRLRMTGGTITGVGGIQIRGDAVYDGTFGSYWVQGGTITATTGAGIYGASTSAYVYITGANISSTGSYGVYISGRFYMDGTNGYATITSSAPKSSAAEAIHFVSTVCGQSNCTDDIWMSGTYNSNYAAIYDPRDSGSLYLSGPALNLTKSKIVKKNGNVFNGSSYATLFSYNNWV